MNRKMSVNRNSENIQVGHISGQAQIVEFNFMVNGFDSIVKIKEYALTMPTTDWEEMKESVGTKAKNKYLDREKKKELVSLLQTRINLAGVVAKRNITIRENAEQEITKISFVLAENKSEDEKVSEFLQDKIEVIMRSKMR